VTALNQDLLDALKIIADEEKLSPIGASPAVFFKSLISKLYYKFGRKVAVLIDEYDYPALEVINQISQADKIRKALKIFCNALKAAEKHRGLTFITGMAKFTQTSIFSALNNPEDLTLNENYASYLRFRHPGLRCLV
jgi:hypothetical protein